MAFAPDTLFVSDLDGTLLDRQDRIPPWSLKTLNRLIDGGLPFTYATARSLASASVVTAGLRVKLPVIVYNGAFIMNQSREVLCSNTFTNEQTRFIAGLLRDAGVSPFVYAFPNTFQNPETVSWVTGLENDGKRRYLSQRRGDRRFRPLADEAGLYDGEIFYFTCIGEREELLPVYEAVKERPGFRCTLQQELYRPEYWCEIMPQEAAKSTAIRTLRDLHGFKRVVSFGDAVNDEPMFAISDVSCAVENAVPELKRLATHVIGSNEEDGVVRWLLGHAGGTA